MNWATILPYKGTNVSLEPWHKKKQVITVVFWLIEFSIIRDKSIYCIFKFWLVMINDYYSQIVNSFFWLSSKMKIRQSSKLYPDIIERARYYGTCCSTCNLRSKITGSCRLHSPSVSHPNPWSHQNDLNWRDTCIQKLNFHYFLVFYLDIFLRTPMI